MVENEEKKGYWFPAKRYGWGWGPPVTWQGWVCMLVYLVVMGPGLLVGILWNLVLGVVVGVLATAAFLIVVWKTGEPPKWRWGNKD
jgi:hypothetical protein